MAKRILDISYLPNTIQNINIDYQLYESSLLVDVPSILYFKKFVKMTSRISMVFCARARYRILTAGVPTFVCWGGGYNKIPHLNKDLYISQFSKIIWSTYSYACTTVFQDTFKTLENNNKITEYLVSKYSVVHSRKYFQDIIKTAREKVESYRRSS